MPGGTGTHAFLIVEDDAELARSLSRLLRARRRGCDVTTASSYGEAKELVFARIWDAIFLDYFLPGGPGLDVLALLRERGVFTPTALLSGALDDKIINRACDLRALPMAKPMESERIEKFLETIDSRAERIRRVGRRWQARYALTEGELDVLVLTAGGVSRVDLAVRRATGDRTIDSHVTHLLRKTRDPSLHAAVERLLRETIDAYGH
jgi:DNA-binding NarL/FixJ family response regulator